MGQVITVTKESQLPMITAVRYLVRNSRSHNSRQSSHALKIALARVGCHKLGIVSPN